MKRLISVSTFLVLMASGAATEQTEATSFAASKPERYVVFFDADTAMISEAVKVILCHAAMDAKARNAPRVRIIRSADWISQGNTDDTLTEAVRDVLAGQGVPSEVIEIGSNGEQSPLLSVGADMRDLYGRRVVVVVDQPHRGPSDNVSLRSSVDM